MQVNQQLQAFKALENPIMSLKSAALILATTYQEFHHTFESFDEANAFAFVLYDVQRRADELEQEFAGCFKINEGR